MESCPLLRDPSPESLAQLISRVCESDTACFVLSRVMRPSVLKRLIRALARSAGTRMEAISWLRRLVSESGQGFLTGSSGP